MTNDNLAIIVGVQQTVSAYARHVDGRRMDLCAKLFTEDARIAVMGEVHEGAAAVRAWLDGMTKRQPGIHLTTNTLVTPTGADTAEATSDVAFINRDEEGWKFIVAGQYVDSLRRGPDGWQFASRTIVLS